MTPINMSFYVFLFWVCFTLITLRNYFLKKKKVKVTWFKPCIPYIYIKHTQLVFFPIMPVNVWWGNYKEEEYDGFEDWIM